MLVGRSILDLALRLPAEELQRRFKSDVTLKQASACVTQAQRPGSVYRMRRDPRGIPPDFNVPARVLADLSMEEFDAFYEQVTGMPRR